jgi:serine/threonine protein kinase
MEWGHLIGQQLGQYDLLAELGAGTYAHVYQAFQPRLRRHVAIKVLHVDTQKQPDFLQNFEHIGQAIAQLNHPNIVSIYDFGEERGLAYIVMQSVTGGTFRTRLGKPMAVGEAVTPFIQLARALHHAHQRGVLHLDLRPENILINQENPSHLLLADFSLSQLFQPEYLTQTGLPIGSPAYLAPEQIAGRQPTTRTDIYALGALLFEALAGRPAFSGPSPATILNKHLHEPPPYIRGFNPAIPRELAHVVSRAMAKQPGERFESAEEFARALEPHRDAKERHRRLHLSLEDLNLVDDEETQAAPQPPREAPSRISGRSQTGTRPQEPDQSGHTMEAALAQEPMVAGQAGARGKAWSAYKGHRQTLTEPPMLPERGPVIAERISLVRSVGTRAFWLVRRMAGKSNLGQWLDHLMPDPRAQGIAGIASISLALILSLSVALLAAAAPPQGNTGSSSLELGVSRPTPTATATSTPTPAAAPSPAAPSPAPTPRGPAIDPRAAAAFSSISASQSADPTCQSNPKGATLPAGTALYVTACFNAQAIPNGGTVTISIVPQGTTAASAQASKQVSGGSSYYWFQFQPLAPGSYTIEAFWNGKLGRVYPLALQ